MVTRIILALLICLLPLYADDQYKLQPPNLDSYKVVKKFTVDVDENGIHETNVTMYKNAFNEKVYQLVTMTRKWAFGVYTKKNNIEGNYTIIDSDCDGRFDKMFDTDTDLSIPPCLQGKYIPPDLTDFQLEKEFDSDGDDDGIKETHVRLYKNYSDDSISSMTTNDKLWAWSLDTNGDDDRDKANNYIIVDSDCNGRFDKKYGLSEKCPLPSCAKDK